jgi:hypothetical protein
VIKNISKILGRNHSLQCIYKNEDAQEIYLKALMHSTRCVSMGTKGEEFRKQTKPPNKATTFTRHLSGVFPIKQITCRND